MAPSGLDTLQVQALTLEDSQERLEAQVELARALARDPIQHANVIYHLLETLHPSHGASDEQRYQTSRVFYWLLMQIRDTETAKPIVDYLERLGREAGREKNTYIAQGLMSAAMEGKKAIPPSGSDTLDPAQEVRLVHTLNCGVSLRQLALGT